MLLVPKIPLFYLLALFNSPLTTVSLIGSLLVGALLGLKERRVKRILAYSSIGTVGLLLALVNNPISLHLYLLGYIFSSYALFKLLGKFNYLTNVKELTLSKNTKVLLFIPVLSLIGLPPFSGFIGKILVLQENLNQYFIVGIRFIIKFNSL